MLAQHILRGLLAFVMRIKIRRNFIPAHAAISPGAFGGIQRLVRLIQQILWIARAQRYRGNSQARGDFNVATRFGFDLFGFDRESPEDEAFPKRKSKRIAFSRCIRFSAWGKMIDCGPSISNPDCQHCRRVPWARDH